MKGDKGNKTMGLRGNEWRKVKVEFEKGEGVRLVAAYVGPRSNHA